MSDDRLARIRKMIEQVDPSRKADGLKETLESSCGMGAGPTLDSHSPGSGGELEYQIAVESLDVLDRGDQLDSQHQFALEAIVMPFYRPVVDIVDNHMTVNQLTSKWKHLGEEENRTRIEQKLLSIGRLEIPGHPSLPYAGTGFVVGQRRDGRSILMTNRHVAEIFSTGIGDNNLDFVAGQRVDVDFLQEFGRIKKDSLKVERVVMIHPFWDMALLEVRGLSPQRQPLTLRTDPPEQFAENEVVVVGYPGYDPEPDVVYQQTQARIFRSVYYVKRLQPGVLKTRDEVPSYGRTVPAITHDCSTLGGNSGSAVINVKSGDVIALHFAGAYLRANYAIPIHDLAQDQRVLDQDLNFQGPSADPEQGLYDEYWRLLKTEGSSKAGHSHGLGRMAQTPSSTSIQSGSTNQPKAVSSTKKPQAAHKVAAFTFSVPLCITVDFGDTTFPSATYSTDVTHHVSEADTDLTEREGLFGREELPLGEALNLFSLDSLSTTGFDWEASLSLAVCSKLAYATASIVEAAVTGTMGFDDGEFVDENETQCFIGSTTDFTLVSFRGTESLRDWLADLNVRSIQHDYGRVHRGFFGAFEDAREQLEEKIRDSGNRSLVLTGHSLGGALATVAAAEWHDMFDIRSVYTYGQPAVVKRGFRDFFKSYLGDILIRFVNDDDIVTRVPPTYVHVGLLKHLDANGNLRPATESFGAQPPTMSEREFDLLRAELLRQRINERSLGSSSTESLGAPATEGLFPSISDHSIDNYISKIRDQK
ncbi:Serine protease [Planctomycetales bacterium 10988]|nr:Serine protease [Planctomycetales bacterium 10988]